MPLPADVARRIAAMSRNSQSIRVPRQPSLTWHQGTLAEVDIGTNTVHFEHNSSGLIIPGVRYMQAYTADHPPTAGDIVWMQLHGTDPLILGRHVVPTSSITF